MCFLIGATGAGVTKAGDAIIGGVSDDPYLFRTFVRAVMPTPGHSHLAHVGTELRYVSSNEAACDLPPPFEVEPGQPSRGVNAAGLAFTCALAVERQVEPHEMKAPPATFADLSRRMMSDCTSVDEAVEMLQKAKTVTPAFSVLLADAGGNLAQVEVGGFGVLVLQRHSRENPGIVVAVNCYQCPELVRFNHPAAVLEESMNNNGRRLRRGWQLAEQYRGNIDAAVLSSILSDHANIEEDCELNPLIKWWGHSICNHGTCSRGDYDATSPPWGTVSAEIMEPSKRSLLYAYGWPCGDEPTFDDQLYQEQSWGCFRAFKVQAEAPERSGVVECTTVFGDITDAGRAFLVVDVIDRQPSSLAIPTPVPVLYGRSSGASREERGEVLQAAPLPSVRI